MSQNFEYCYPLNIEEFIDDVLMPSESFAKICLQAALGADIDSQPGAHTEDIGIVCAALTEQAKYRLYNAMSKIAEQTGSIEFFQEKRKTVNIEVKGIYIKNKLYEQS